MNRASAHFIVQRQADQLESMYITLSMNKDLKNSNALVVTRKFQSVVHTCGEKTDTEWANDSSGNRWDFGQCTVQQKKYTTL
jgi:hypothetical protein